jgi:hypothetical protein
MYDYGELLKLPYKESDILDPLKKLVKYDIIKPYALEKFDEDTNTFHLVGRKKLTKVRLSIRIKELEKGYIEVEIIAKSKHPENGICKNEVKNIVNIIFKELENCERTKGNHDFSVEVLKIKNNAKMIRGIIDLVILLYLVYRILFSLIAEDYYTYMVGDLWHYPKLQLIWSIITTGFIMFFRRVTYKSRVKKRITNIKSQIYKLIEKKDEKKTINENTNDKNIKGTAKDLTNKAKPYIKKGIDYVNKTKAEKPKLFWTVAISFGALVTWGIVGMFTGPTHIEGVFVQQRDGYTGNFVPVEITFKDGLAYGSGATSGYLDGKYEYKIRGNKIYVIIKGQEVFSELTIKNKNTLIYGDGVVDRDCDPYQYGGVTMECYNNGDGIYIKQ